MMRPVNFARLFPELSSSKRAVPIPSEAQSGAERTPTPTRNCAAAREGAAATPPYALIQSYPVLHRRRQLCLPRRG
jgi:hypothetical protein